MNPGTENLHSVTKCAEDKTGKVYALCAMCVYVSDNGTTDWYKITEDLTGVDMQFDKLNYRYLVALPNGTSGNRELYFSNATMPNWIKMTPEGCSGKNLNILLDESKIFLANDNDLLYSFDKCTTWNKAGASDVHYKFNKMFRFKDKYLAYGLVSGASRGLYESTDGITWNSVSISPAGLNIQWIEKDPYSDNLFSYTGYTTGLYLSKDGGVNWTAINDGLPTDFNSVGCMGFSKNGSVYIQSSGTEIMKNTFETNSVENLSLESGKIANISYGNGSITVTPSDAKINISKVSIYSSIGVEVANIDHCDYSFSFQTDFLTSGAYYVIVRAGRESDVLKFVKFE